MGHRRTAWDIPRLALIALVAVCGAGSVATLAQQGRASTPAGVVSGRVVDGTSGTPVAGAIVSLTTMRDDTGAAVGPSQRVMADAAGRFVIRGLSAGEFQVRASHPGWRGGPLPADVVPGGEADRGTFADRIRLSPGERATLDVPLWRDALISGQVTDESGEPIAEARVSASAWFAVAGRRRLQPIGTASTDDRGTFTLSVQPGEYVIEAASTAVHIRSGNPDPSANRAFVFERTFYPGAPAVTTASVLRLGPGATHSGIGIQMPLRPAARVTGVLRNTSGIGRLPVRVELVHRDDSSVRYVAPIDAGGRFGFPPVPQGGYVLWSMDAAGRGASGDRPLWVRAAVEVGDRDLDIEVDVHRHLHVSGRVQFAGATPIPAAPSIALRRHDATGSDVVYQGAPVGADGRFTIEAPPGRYLLTVSVPAREIVSRDDLFTSPPPDAVRAAQAWSLESAMSNGRDVADAPLLLTGDVSDLVVTITDQPLPALGGGVSSRGGPPEHALVVLFPADESLWVDVGTGRRFRAVRPARDGAFAFTPVPPAGDYFVAAVRWTATERELMHPPRLGEIARMAGTRRVTLSYGQPHHIDLDAIAAPVVSAALSPAPVGIEPFDRARVLDRPAAPRGAVIAGRVLAAGSQEPIASARVFVPQAQRETHTDDQGRFVLDGLPPGQHVLRASRMPYVNAVYGAAHATSPGTPVTLAEGERVDDVTITMVRGAAIGGTVRDHNGEPRAGAQVSVFSVRWQAQGRVLEPLRLPEVALGVLVPSTDARGQYRLYGLPAGSYMLVVTPSAGAQTAVPLTTRAEVDAAAAPDRGVATERRSAGHPALYHPNTFDPAAAQVITLASGDDVAVDFQFPLLPLSEVSGVVRTPDGVPPTSVSMMPADVPGYVRGRPTRLSGTVDRVSGAFTFHDVPPGRYTITPNSLLAAALVPPAPRLSGSVDVIVAGDLHGILLDLGPGGTVSGRVIEWPALMDAWSALRLRLSPLGPGAVSETSPAQAGIDSEGRFSFSGVEPGRYRMETILPGPVTAIRPRVTAQRAGGLDTIDPGLDVRAGDRIDVDVSLALAEAQVGGLVLDTDGRPTAVPLVILFARDPQAWTPPSRRIFAVRPDQNGGYLFPDVPAGAYLLATLADAEPGEWFDPARLARLAPGGTPVDVLVDDRLDVTLTAR